MSSEETRIVPVGEASRGAQFTWAQFLRMGMRNLMRQRTASCLQLATIAATAAFVAFALAELVVLRASEGLPTAAENPLGAVPQLVWILVIALLVCTISNVTSMLLNVTKRYREIGTMKCLGAVDRTVLTLFLAEALLLGLAGSAAGSLLGGAVSLLLALFQHGTAILTASVLSGVFLGMAGTVVVASALTFLGAAYPARRAARMLPVEAMRTA